MRRIKGYVSILAIVIMLASAVFALVYFSRITENKRVVATIFPIYDICREILGSEEDVMLLEDNGVDMHSYNPSTQDIAAIKQAELFVYIGGDGDKWIQRIDTSSNVNFQSLCLIDKVEVVENEEHEHDHMHTHGEIDEHIWLSLKNMVIMTQEILSKLIEVFPHKQVMLEDNAERYISKLNTLDKKYEEALKNQLNTIVVADRFPFVYLARDYHMDFLAAFEGCSSNASATADMFAELIEKVNDEKLKNICVLETSSPDYANTVINGANDKNIEVLVLDTCQSVTFKNVKSKKYIDVMTENLNKLKKAINNESN